MLSRIAESLFWIGRYMERADGVARILEVHLERITQLPEHEQDREARRIMTIMGVEPQAEAGVRQMIHELAWNQETTTSIAGSVRAARENARRARETVSSGLWQALNATNYGLSGHSRDTVGTFGLCRWASERISMTRGLADMTMSHDQSWQFLTLGVTLERADMTARLLWTRASSGGVSSEATWAEILECAGAYEAFLRSRGGSFNDESATRFLMLDRLFPRTIIYSLRRADKVLADLDPGGGRLGVTSEARRAVGRTLIELEYDSAEDIVGDLPRRLNDVQSAIGRASRAVGDKYFNHAQEASWFGGVL
ncbi:alpha-E domain-containing protein [Kocuria palustris]|uniref:alpha-E domain-containing protein n=1 Tax=Kocuria palustris TaxID=71999 RepID=UPI0011A7CF8C|nr:alpha-E domain-containing protein [Kocuria palustris]